MRRFCMVLVMLALSASSVSAQQDGVYVCSSLGQTPVEARAEAQRTVKLMKGVVARRPWTGFETDKQFDEATIGECIQSIRRPGESSGAGITPGLRLVFEISRGRESASEFVMLEAQTSTRWKAVRFGTSKDYSSVFVARRNWIAEHPGEPRDFRLMHDAENNLLLLQKRGSAGVETRALAVPGDAHTDARHALTPERISSLPAHVLPFVREFVEAREFRAPMVRETQVRPDTVRVRPGKQLVH